MFEKAGRKNIGLNGEVNELYVVNTLLKER
jgi:hypothetical protein